MPEPTTSVGPIEDECLAYLASVPWLDLLPDERLTVGLAFLGGAAAALRLVRMLGEPGMATSRLIDTLERETLALTERAAGVRA